MGAVPRHPFFLRVIESLQAYNKQWGLPYITIMYSTGPLFLSVIWKEYMNLEPSESGRVRILMPDEYNKHAWSFFKHYRGSSWHGKDAKLIFWVRVHLLRVSLVLITAADGWSLDASYRPRVYACRHDWNLPLVDLWPDPATRCAEIPVARISNETTALAETECKEQCQIRIG